MPLLSLTLSGANGKPHDWTHVSTPFTEVQTLLNTTGLDTTNVQENGLVPADIRTNANIDAVRIKVRNATGGSLSAGTLVYFSGTYSDGTTNYPKVAKAVSHATASSNYFAQGLLVATTANGADGTAAVFYELSGIDTSSTSVGDLIYLDTTAGGWTKTRPTGGQYIQVVGTVTVVHASTGRIAFAFGSVPEFLTGGSSGLGASVQTFTVQGASGAAADIYHIADAGEDNADKWKISVADGGIRTWENYTSGSYAAKMTLNSSGALQTSGSITSGGFIIGSASITEAELETIDGVTAGTVAVSKAVVVDSNKDIGTFRNVTIDGTFSDGNYTFDTSGNVSGLGTIASGAITSTGVVTGTGFTIGSAVINEAELETIDGITAGTVVASKAVVVDSNKDIGTFRNITLDGTLSDGNYTFDTSGNVSGLGTVGCGAISSTADLTIFDDQNNADTSLSIGTSATEALKIEVLNGGSDKTAQEIKITSSTASGTANHGKFSFYVDDVEIFDIDDGGIDMASGKTVAVDGTDLTSSSAANAFQTIAVSGQDNVVADSTTDTLTFAAGSNVTLTTTAGSDTVTIAAAAAAAGSSSIVTTGALNSGSITSGFGNIDNGSSTLDTGAATLASLVCTAAGTFGGGYGSTGATISTAGVGQFNGNLTTDGLLAAATMTLSSTSTISGDMTFADNVKVTLGDGGDADLYYDGTNTILLPQVAGTGGLVIDYTAQASTAGSTAQVVDIFGTGWPAMTISHHGANADPATLALNKSRSGTKGTHAYPVANDGLGSIFFGGSDEATSNHWGGAVIEARATELWASDDHPGYIQFKTTPNGSYTLVERMRIADTGALTTSAAYSGWGYVLTQSHGSNPNGLNIHHSASANDDSGGHFINCTDGTQRFQVFRNGDVTTSDDGILTSDSRLKTNIVDASNKLADLMRLKVRNFEWTPEYHPNQVGEKKIGFIAQEFEEVFPSLVTEYDISGDNSVTEELYTAEDAEVLYIEGDIMIPPDKAVGDVKTLNQIPEGKSIGDVKVAAKAHEPMMRKSYKNALVPMLVKALQELTARVETLEAA